MKSLRRLICLVLFGVLMLMIASGCNRNVNRPQITHEPVTYQTQPPLPEDYDMSSAEVKYQDGNLKFLTSESFSSSRAKGEVSATFKAQYAEFALRLLEGCYGGEGTLVSPLSVLTALQMVANGAQGQTLDEMMKVLGGNIDRDTMNQQLFNYYESLRSSDGAKFHVANAVWMTDNDNFLVNKGFVDIVDNTFRAQLAKVPFTDPATVDAINKWGSDNTDGMIPKVLEYDDVDANTVMVLANALCFDAQWRNIYDESQIKDSTFHGSRGNTTVQMMYSYSDHFIEGPSETGFIKSYNGRYEFVTLLPNKDISLDDYLKSMSGEEFLKLLDTVDYDCELKAGLPKFSMDQDVSLPNVLKSMGINAAFDPAAADFSALGSLPGGNIYIADVLHNTHINVNENGTVAAAITEVIADAKSAPFQLPRRKATVILDRPFVYAIVDTESMLPIFIGAVTDI